MCIQAVIEIEQLKRTIMKTNQDFQNKKIAGTISKIEGIVFNHGSNPKSVILNLYPIIEDLKSLFQCENNNEFHLKWKEFQVENQVAVEFYKILGIIELYNKLFNELRYEQKITRELSDTSYTLLVIFKLFKLHYNISVPELISSYYSSFDKTKYNPMISISNLKEKIKHAENKREHTELETKQMQMELKLSRITILTYILTSLSIILIIVNIFVK